MSLENLRSSEYSSDIAALFRRVTNWISRSQDLSEILRVTVTEVGEFLSVDRVKIYQFQADGCGQVVAEHIRDQRLPSLLGLMFPADDIPPQARELFIRARARSIVDLSTQQIGQSVFQQAHGEIAYDDIRYRPVDPCHIEYLMAMGVQSSLVIPIVQQDQLWGLFVVHNAEPRTIAEDQLQAVQMIVDLLTVAIAQSILTEQASREAAHNRISRLLHSLSTIELQAALEETIAAFAGSGGRLWVYAQSLDSGQPAFSEATLPSCCVRLFKAGCQPIMPENAPFPLMEQYHVWQDRFQSDQDGVWAIADLYKEPKLRNLQSAFRETQIRGILMIPLWYRQQLLGYLSIFRNEIETEVLWAGQVDPDQRQLYPRQSFEVWKDTRRGQALPWAAIDLDLAKSLGHQFATAIQQYETHQQLQALNASLESQVKERTAKLHQATEYQRALFEVVTDVRKSLDLKTIFATVTQEMLRSLSVDRVCIYEFDLDTAYNKGVIIAEAVLPEFPAALDAVIEDHCFGERYATQYQQGRVSTIADVETAGILDCYRAVFERFAIRSNIVAPVLKGETLWGLLSVHQCSRSRQWTEPEIQFVTQVAAQLSIAIEQADLLLQTQQQAEQLSAALSTLQRTQTQLIQSEKMSSLGQLVAGVAHEINNPVNFIHGNLTHLHSHVSNLLSLIDTYQTCYPTPTPEVEAQAQDIDLEFLSQDLPKIVASMQLGTDRIRQIVLSLRNFSRLDQADMKLVDIHEGIDSTLLILQYRFKANGESPGVELIKEYGELPLVECFPSQLNQVFMNVVSNAIDALEEAGTYEGMPTIRISTQVIEEQAVVIRISDNGIGIPKEILSRIFDPFFTTKPIGKGTGMGLSISYDIVVEKHGGVFKCHSEPGQGTEFWIEIPLRQTKR